MSFVMVWMILVGLFLCSAFYLFFGKVFLQLRGDTREGFFFHLRWPADIFSLTGRYSGNTRKQLAICFVRKICWHVPMRRGKPAKRGGGGIAMREFPARMKKAGKFIRISRHPDVKKYGRKLFRSLKIRGLRSDVGLPLSRAYEFGILSAIRAMLMGIDTQLGRAISMTLLPAGADWRFAARAEVRFRPAIVAWWGMLLWWSVRRA